MHRTQIYLQSGQQKRLKTLAYREGTSVSEVIRRLIAEKISEKPGTTGTKKPKYRTAGEWARAQARWAEENGIHGPADLAANLDQYLYADKK